MVPTIYIQLDEMPLTPNGKIDRKALPEPDVSAGTQNVPPENRLEENCLRIASEVLPSITFGVTDDLLALGLNSLKTMLLVSRFNSELRMWLRVSDIMRYKTIRGYILGKKRISWLYEEYDELKPPLVFVQGIVMFSDTKHLHNFYDDVVAFYLTIVQLMLPEEAKIAGFVGFSFGGAVTFGMATDWQKITDESVPVIMGDTTLPKAGKIPPNEIKQLTAEDLRKMVDAFEVKEH